MISSVAPALLSALTIAESKVGSVIGDSPDIPTGAQDRRQTLFFELDASRRWPVLSYHLATQVKKILDG